MANIIDYIKWRGDIGFDKSPINEVDAIILCTLSYLRYSEIVNDNFRNGIRLREAAAKFSETEDYSSRVAEVQNVDPNTVSVLQAAGESVRFGDLYVEAFRDIFLVAQEEQFSAITFYSKEAKWHFVTYRGTDNRLVGWKEDLNLCFMDVIPSQTDSIKYLMDVASHTSGKLYVGGHSKGGNLAIFASKNVDKKIKKRIETIYDFDGPGFNSDFFDTDEYDMIADKIKTYVPGLSMVGAIFEKREAAVVAEADGKGIYQHDPFNWKTSGPHFVELEDVYDESKVLGKTVNEWYKQVDIETRKCFADSVYKLLLSTKLDTITGLQANMVESILKVLGALRNLDPDTKKLVNDVMLLFARNGIENVSEEFKKNSQNFFDSIGKEVKQKIKEVDEKVSESKIRKLKIDSKLSELKKIEKEDL